MDKATALLWQARFEKKTNWLRGTEILQEALAADNGNYEILLELGDIYSDKKLYKKAIDVYLRILQKYPHDSSALFKIANCYLTINEAAIAIRYYDLIEEYFPEALYNKAIAYSRLGHSEKTVEILENLIENNPVTELPFYLLSEQYMELKDYHKALEKLSVMNKQFGNQGKILFLQGYCHYNLKMYLQAYLSFEQAEKLKYNSTTFYRAYGLTCQKTGKSSKAAQLLLEGIKRDPLNVFIYIDLINLFAENGQLEEAISIARAAQKISPLSSKITTVYDELLSRLLRKKEV